MTLGPDNPYVSPDNLYNGIAKTVEAAGLKSPDLYFTKPTPEDIQRRMQATQPQQPDAAMQRLQMEAQLATEKTRMESENARRKLEMERELKLAEIQQNGALKRYQIDAEFNLKREQNLAEMAGGTHSAYRRDAGMIRMNKRGYDASGVKPGHAAFGGESDDDLYETRPKSTTALELRDFGEEANSQLPNWGKGHGRDEGVEVAATYVMSNTNPTGWPIQALLGNNMHSGLFIIPDDGDAEGRFLYDPSGSYMSREMGSGRALYGPEVSPEDYLKYQLRDGPNVTVRKFATTPEEEAEIIRRADENGDGGYAGCTTSVSRAISGVGPFRGVGETDWPVVLDRQLRGLNRHVGEATDLESLRRMLKKP